MDAINTLACVHWGNEPAANPYWKELAIALGFLVLVRGFWIHVRPEPRPVLRAFALAACGVTILVTTYQVLFATSYAYREPCFRFVLQASISIAVCLCVEVILALRPKQALAPAVARKRQ